MSPAIPATIRPMQASRADRRRVAEEHDAEHRGADRADAGPDRVGGADRQVAQREPEQPEADDHRGDGQERRHRPGEALGVLQPDRPADLEDAGDDEQDPGHGRSSEARSAQAVRAERVSRRRSRARGRPRAVGEAAEQRRVEPGPGRGRRRGRRVARRAWCPRSRSRAAAARTPARRRRRRRRSPRTRSRIAAIRAVPGASPSCSATLPVGGQAEGVLEILVAVVEDDERPAAQRRQPRCRSRCASAAVSAAKASAFAA